MRVHYSTLMGGKDWHTIPYSIWSDCFNLEIVHHKNRTSPNVCASSVELLMLITVDQHLYGNYQKGDDWVY